MKYTPIDYNKDFEGKIAIVTGASSGIGKAVKEALLFHGAKVFNLDIKDTDYKTDVSDSDQVKKIIEKIVKEHGAPTFLVNNAGIEYNNDGNIVTMPRDKRKRILDVNLGGYMNMVDAVVPYMEKTRDGRIVNISSVQATQSCLPGTMYQVTKEAILGLTRVLTLEYAKKGIRVNTVSPGGIKTEGMGNVRIEDNPAALDNLIKSTPLGRRGHAEEVANAVLFLLSSGASYINGANLVVDGGMLNTLVGDMGLPEEPVKDDPDKD